MGKEVKVAIILNENFTSRESGSCRHRARVPNVENGPCQRCERRGRGGNRMRAILEKMKRQRHSFYKPEDVIALGISAQKSSLIIVRRRNRSL